MGLVTIAIIFLVAAATPFIFPSIFADTIGHFLAARPDTYYGQLLTRLRDYDTALYAFNRAVAIRPNYSKAWEKMGNLFLLMDEHDSAYQAFRLARED
ncbi:MAG: hypothetical protein ACW975_10745 [Candidatus Thorarchaeota archaeon]